MGAVVVRVLLVLVGIVLRGCLLGIIGVIGVIGTGSLCIIGVIGVIGRSIEWCWVNGIGVIRVIGGSLCTHTCTRILTLKTCMQR